MSDQERERRNDETELRGIGNDVKGKIKDAAGGLTGDTSMQAEGKWDQLKGKAQKTIADVRRDVDRDSDRDRDI